MVNSTTGSPDAGSALACCALLMQLGGIKPQVMPEPAGNLRRQVRRFGRANGVQLALTSLPFARLGEQDLPLIYRRHDGQFLLLARLNETQALIQPADGPAPQVISREELAAEWSGEVIRLQGAALRFDVSWFIPEFMRHRQLLGEVLLFSMMLQLLALASPLFSR